MDSNSNMFFLDYFQGTEITFNYNWAGDRQNTGLTPCFCGTTSCGGFIGIKRADGMSRKKKK